MIVKKCGEPIINSLGFTIGSPLFRIALKTKEYVESIGGKAQLEQIDNDKYILNIISGGKK